MVIRDDFTVKEKHGTRGETSFLEIRNGADESTNRKAGKKRTRTKKIEREENDRNRGFCSSIPVSVHLTVLFGFVSVSKVCE